MTKAGASILIVDDDEMIRGLLGALLDPSFWCATAATAEEAMTLLESGSFNLVLSDITMPGASGIELCRHIHKTNPRTVVVMISALTDIQYAVDSLREGAFDYITKPFDLGSVMRSVDRALRYQQAIEDKHRYEQALEERVRIRANELRAANGELNSLLDLMYRNYRATLRGLAKTLEARDIETRGHCDRVVAYSIRLGKQMGLAPRDLIGLEQGALLHDIGKIGVPDAILLKPSKLTTDEWVKMREHVGHGLRIIGGVEYLSEAQFVVGQHHEKFDGGGYPHKLREGDIHIYARIFAVADAFDAIRSDRPYRAAQSYARACEEILAHSGSHFDPTCANAFMSIPEAEWEEIRRCANNEGWAEQLIDRREISSFILSLKSPDAFAQRVEALCA
jgi:response regulator RpfG family c-di-GMP phosphodiesterase